MSERMWAEKKWPIRNGIYFADDRVVLLDVLMPWETESKKMSVKVDSSLTVQEIKECVENTKTNLASLCEATDSQLKFHIYAGEGAHGSEGFVAVTHRASGNLVWLLYCDCSNPFVELKVESNKILAKSSLDQLWSFPLETPESVVVGELQS